MNKIILWGLILIATLATNTFAQNNMGEHQKHRWVDLGLPSGTKWATMNIGATRPSDYGRYFAWGEVRTKNDYSWETLKYCSNRDSHKFSKYVLDRAYGNIDGKTELEPEDDAATANWGDGWKTPSLKQFNELFRYCSLIWEKMNGHAGYKLIGPNENWIFLPAAGYKNGRTAVVGNVIVGQGDVGTGGRYWTRTLSPEYSDDACCLIFLEDEYHTSTSSRESGRTIRAVFEVE